MIDTNTPLDSDYGDGISLSRADVNNLRTAGKWGRFISIVGLAFMGIFLLLVLIFGGESFSFFAASLLGPGGVGGALIIAFYLLIIGIIIYCYILLFQFSTSAIKAADTGNASAVSNALKSLARLWKVIGITIAAYIGFIVLGMTILRIIFT